MLHLKDVLERVSNQRSAMRQQYGTEPTMILLDSVTYDSMCYHAMSYAAADDFLNVPQASTPLKRTVNGLFIYDLPAYLIDIPKTYCECVLHIAAGE